MTTATTTERPVSLSRTMVKGTHPLTIGDKDSVHPQYAAGWDAFLREYPSAESARYAPESPKGFHIEFRAGWAGARALMLATSKIAKVEPMEGDPVTAAIFEWRERLNALRLKPKGPRK